MRVGHKQCFYNSHYICYGMIKGEQFLSLRYKKMSSFQIKKKTFSKNSKPVTYGISVQARRTTMRDKE